ncbi:PREDICTED: uncharacterized protein C1orf131 homolog [Dinoponera quadriceps]|uniref:Uncharacterized protein C1orf131 homolog n=1 Tax=Dinoponera quadriceps TaxID=609295 RepID=A0A6P3YED6_DINQU|nr:PREDICTED: uncharacterized protein C1orf131 homolog [Dinoponera quadriceps]XP_014488148.1 PREDICTED: uncharacterized protein C1orf131 homolog [Dinoponera quadriceps]
MEDFVSTRASDIKRNYVSVNYEVPKKKVTSTDSFVTKRELRKNDTIDSMTKRNSAELRREQEKEMKRARFDVIKLGMSGFGKEKARKTKIELAVSLGAVPPKNKRMNYKKLKLRRKTDDEKIKKEQHTSGFTSSLLKPKLKKNGKKNSGILGVYGKVSKNAPSKQKSRI